MIDLYDLPHFESGKYLVFFDNIMGHGSMVTIMTKDRSAIVNDGSFRSTCRAGFVQLRYDSVAKMEVPEFSWNSDVEELPELPFTENLLLEKYKKARRDAFGE